MSVVTPFFGDEAAAREVATRLRALRLAPGDEVILADNTPSGTFGRAVPNPPFRVAVAAGERSSYHARNVGAELARGDWLLFLDADCVPPPDLIDAYFAQPVEPRVGLMAGPIRPAPDQTGLLPDWAATRQILSQQAGTERDPPGAATANLMVRRSDWAAVGGFFEGIRSGEDHEFSWRVGDTGRLLEYRPGAAVDHINRDSLRGVVRQMTRYAAGNAWQNRRRPDAAPPPLGPKPVLRAVAAAPIFLLTLRPRRAALKVIDAIVALFQIGGGLLGNGVAPRLPPEGDEQRLVIATDRFPVPSETFVTEELAALRDSGRAFRVEAIERPACPAHGGARGADARYAEDEGTLDRLRSLVWVVARHPLRALADFVVRRRVGSGERLPLRAVAPFARRLAAGGERQVNVHSTEMACVIALRAGRIAGVSVSLTGARADVDEF